MSDVVIRAEQLGKKYVIGHEVERERYVTLRDVIARTARGFARTANDIVRGRPVIVGDEVEQFWALKGVDFEIKRGEVVGVIGRNGAGKSTLLKILSRITEPSTGRVQIKGRVASLLEVGTGFHPELTGRENIYLNGAILGMTRGEIHRKFEEIVAFADVEKFLDTPVKRYSSGMYVRLAFAVAAHLEPEIFIVDEVLAVGDAEFQKKCLGKMHNLASHGRTILFVSHNVAAVQELCASAMLLQNGQLVDFGDAASITSQYIQSGNTRQLGNTRSLAFYRKREDVATRCACGQYSIEAITIESSDGAVYGKDMIGKLVFVAPAAMKDVVVGIGFSSPNGTRILSYDSDFPDGKRFVVPSDGRFAFTFRFHNLPLSPDIYSVDAGLRRGGLETLDYIRDFGRIEVLPTQRTPAYFINRHPTVRLPSAWALEGK